MATDPAAELASLRHDVNAKCSNLKIAAAQLRGDMAKEELELIGLMSEQARWLADRLAAFAEARRGNRRK